MAAQFIGRPTSTRGSNRSWLFLIKRPIVGEVSVAQARLAVEAVAPAIELIDSRFEDFKFSLTNVVADNSSASGFILGPLGSPEEALGDLRMVLSADGQPRETGSTAAIVGDPWLSLVAAIRLAGEAQEPLGPGDIVMAGGATAAISLEGIGHVRLQMRRLGDVELFVET